MCINIYIYIYREREREKSEREIERREREILEKNGAVSLAQVKKQRFMLYPV